MCLECGCGKVVGEVNIAGLPSGQVRSPLLGSTATTGEVHSYEPHDHDHDHGHEHQHGDDHEHSTPHAHDTGPHTVTVNQAVLAKNDRLAERNRGYFRAKGLLVLNMVSAPGSGKTTFIQKTATALGSRLKTGVIVGDLATDNDAARLRGAGVPVVQITTGTVCHLEAEMVARAMSQLDLDALNLLIIENVGNLVCPAVYDLGEDLRVVLFSTTEGEDKPLKYPPMFHSADVAVLTKSDLASAAGFEREKALANLRQISHHATIFELSARTGEGMEAWCEFLLERHKAGRA
jgi:hydrogenase nickel incorporation protein HypB